MRTFGCSFVISDAWNVELMVFTSRSQLDSLSEAFPDDHPSIPLLRKVLAEFRDDELEHLDTAILNESQQAPAYALLSAIIAGGCRLAIGTTEKV